MAWVTRWRWPRRRRSAGTSVRSSASAATRLAAGVGLELRPGVDAAASSRAARTSLRAWPAVLRSSGSSFPSWARKPFRSPFLPSGFDSAAPRSSSRAAPPRRATPVSARARIASSMEGDSARGRRTATNHFRRAGQLQPAQGVGVDQQQVKRNVRPRPPAARAVGRAAVGLDQAYPGLIQRPRPVPVGLPWSPAEELPEHPGQVDVADHLALVGDGQLTPPVAVGPGDGHAAASRAGWRSRPGW